MKHPTYKHIGYWLLVLLMFSMFLTGCSNIDPQSISTSASVEQTAVPPTVQQETEKVSQNEQAVPTSEHKEPLDSANTDFINTEEIYLAGGCFWGIEHLMASMPGVIDAESGYANGTCAMDANYETVCAGETGFRETVRVTYDPRKTSLDALLFAYFYVIDPTVENQQGHDIGTQYQTGIYYVDEASKATVERIVEIEKSRHEAFKVEIGPLYNYFPAEIYHQDYLENNPFGYCHIPIEEIRLLSGLRIDPGKYPKLDEETLRNMLTAEQYEISQEGGTEYAYQNEYWNFFEKGIYVDRATGEPLFSSEDKYESSCGWPSFTKPIEFPSIIEIPDNSHGMERTEVRSRAGNSHLGHVFEDDPESPNGTRYCINSASIMFIPYHLMEFAGYDYLMNIFTE